MKVVVVGCTHIGAELAVQLARNHHQVAMVERKSEMFQNLPSSFAGRLVEGDPLSRDTLRRAGIEQADALVATSDSDALNAVVARIAQEHYHVPKVLINLVEPRYRDLLESVGVQMISSADWGAQRVQELLEEGGAHAGFSVGQGEFKVYELLVPEWLEGHSVAEALGSIPGQPISLVRAGRALSAEPGSLLMREDLLYIAAPKEAGDRLSEGLPKPEPKKEI